MRAIRLWLLLLSFALGIFAAVLVLLPRSLGEQLDHELNTRLERTQHAAALLLRVNARKWIDTSAQVASDAVLIEALDQATRGPADLQIVHKTVQDRLRYFNERMKVDLVVATDARGRVIARVGLDAASYKDSVEGYPLVADALRGLRGDDTWSIGGKLYRVAASPIIQRDHYVGAIIIGQEASGELAESMKAALGAEVVILLRGRVIASTASLPILDRLPISASSVAAELGHGGRSSATSLDSWGVVFGAFAGEAAEHQAMFALCAPRRSSAPLMTSLVSLLDRDPRTLPWPALAPVGGGLLMLLVIGLWLVSRFGARPLRRLAVDAQSLSRGELQRLPEPNYRGDLAIAARAVNSTLERIAGRVRAETRAAAIPPPVERGRNGDVTDRSKPGDDVNPAQFEENTTRAHVGHTPRPSPAPMFTQSLTPLPPPLMAGDTLVREPQDLGEPLSISAPGLSPLSAPSSAPLPIDASALGEEVESTRRHFEEQTSVQSPSEALLVASANDTTAEVEEDFRRVFDEFVATRQQCGETMDGVTFDKFVVKLRQNRSQLIQRYGCSGVRFQVYIRDGRTALKATPVS